MFALSKVRSEHVPVSTTGIQCGESREDNTIDETSYARLNLRYCGWPDVGWVFHWAGRWWGSRVAQRHPSRGFPLSSHPRWRDRQLLSQTGILILYSRNITENFMFEEIFSMLIRPHPTHSTVKEGNFVLEYNFVQKKVFLCELLLTYLSSWRVKNFF